MEVHTVLFVGALLTCGLFGFFADMDHYRGHKGFFHNYASFGIAFVLGIVGLVLALSN